VSWQLAWVVQLFVEGTRHSSISEINKVFLIYFDLMEVLVWFWFMAFNATFNNISAISWQSVLLVEENGKWKFYGS
jgi:hypothetical protein